MLDWRCILAIVKFLLWRVSCVAITGEFFEEWVIFSILNTEKDFMKIEDIMICLGFLLVILKVEHCFCLISCHLLHHVIFSLEGFLATSFHNIVKWWTWVEHFLHACLITLSLSYLSPLSFSLPSCWCSHFSMYLDLIAIKMVYVWICVSLSGSTVWLYHLKFLNVTLWYFVLSLVKFRIWAVLFFLEVIVWCWTLIVLCIDQFFNLLQWTTKS